MAMTAPGGDDPCRVADVGVRPLSEQSAMPTRETETRRNGTVGANDVAGLIACCVRGDDQAQARFYAEFAGLVRCAVVRKLGATGAYDALRSDVDDMCNEVFARLFADDCRLLRRLHKPRSIQAWLMTIAQNHAVDQVRKWGVRWRTQAVAKETHEQRYNEGPDARAIASERLALLNKHLNALSYHERLVLDLFFVQGLKHVEIARVLGININTASARLRRAKAKLRNLVEEDRHELTC